MKRETIIKLIIAKCGLERPVAEVAADEMIRDDFPKNGIRTMGAALGYIEHVAGLLAGRRGA